ncbi:MAG: tetratricopeptide repeat protein [Sphingomonas sp.]
MKHRALASLGFMALLVGSSVVALSSTMGGMASASGRASIATADAAAAKARRALENGKFVLATKFAEAAVQAAPDVPSYRALLGQIYLQQGRFDSARTALSDALSLQPGDGRVALNLALAQIATGVWADARKTLDDNSDVIPASDRGLAMALAGDPASAVQLLSASARTPGADAKTRQNLALSLALAGQWREARAIAALDLSPADVDKRIEQWALFARPQGAADQVSSMLGVVAVQDPGLPVALALSAQVPTSVAAKAPVDAFMPGQAPNASVVVAEAAAVSAAPVVSSLPAPAITVAVTSPDPEAVVVGAAKATSGVVFAARQEVVQRLPARVAKVAAAPVNKQPTSPASALAKRTLAAAVASVSVNTGVAAQPIAKGNFYVQLGAYANAAIARDGWRRMATSVSVLGDHSPSGMAFKSGAGSFYRLSVGGFARGDAVLLCRKVRNSGNKCFVREGAGDQAAAWAKPAR